MKKEKTKVQLRQEKRKHLDREGTGTTKEPKSRMNRENIKDVVPPKPKAKFPEGKKRTGRDDYSKEIVPPHVKDKPYGGKKDEETKEQAERREDPARNNRSFSNKALKELRKYKKEYRV